MLKASGMPDAEIRRRQYATLQLQGRARVARVLLRTYGDETVRTIPGMIQKDGTDGRPYWTLACGPSLVIPVRDVQGRILALRPRLDKPPTPKDKYRWFSSAGSGGPAVSAQVHVPLSRDSGHAAGVVRVTEGEKKADLATVLDPSGIRTVSVPGVAMGNRAIPILHGMGGVNVVHLAYDSDFATEPNVARALLRVLAELDKARLDVAIERWDPKHKGIDDAFLAGAAIEVLR